MARMLTVFLMLFLLNSREAASQLHLKPAGDTAEKRLTLRPLPQNFYSQHTGFFCKKEVQVQRIVRLPIYFRLGSKELTDRLEGKLNH